MKFTYLLSFRLLSYAHEEQRERNSQTKFLSRYREKRFLKPYAIVPVTLWITLDWMVRK